MKVHASAGPGVRHGLVPALVVLTIVAVTVVQRAAIAPTNFGGVDEWLLLDLTSRGILSVPYAHRPLVLLPHAAARLWPGDLTAFAGLTTLYVVGAGVLTAALARRIGPADPLLALLAGTAAAAWAPLDHLRLDTVLICGYAGFAFAAFAALLCFVESWHRSRPALLALGALLGVVSALGVEAVLPLLAVAPVLLPVWRGRRVLVWTLAWWSAVALAALVAAVPLLRGEPSYQVGALGMDPMPWRVAARIARLLAMQATPLVASAPGELWSPRVGAAAALFALGALVVGSRRVRPDPGAESGTRRALLIGVLLGVAGHAALALTPHVLTPARTQVLAAPGFGLALAAVVAMVRRRLTGRLGLALAAAAGCWVVAVGTGRVLAMQSEWDRDRSLYPAQSSALASLTAAAPALAPGTLVLLLDETGSWPIGLTFRHAVRYLYGDAVVGLVHGAESFLYPYRFVPEGVAIHPWPVIRGPWHVQPTVHGWDTIVLVQQRTDGPLHVLTQWPSGPLPPLPAGAVYDPRGRIAAAAVRSRERRVLFSPRTDGGS